MSKITEIFKTRMESGKKVNIAYITPEYPVDDITCDLTLMLAENNVQIVELGVPFSDPLADGPTIQHSSFDALQKHVNLHKILNDVRIIRIKSAVGIVLMTYINPVLAYGTDKFLLDAKNAGVDGLIIPDLPVDEIEFIVEKIKLNNLDLILLAAPTTPDDRLKKIASNSSGFLYCVSITGVTGVRKTGYIADDIITFLSRVRSGSDIPIALGFGLSEYSQIKKFWDSTDGFIIGSALIKSMENARNKQEAIEAAKNFINSVFRD